MNKTPLEQRQERIQKCRDIVEANKDKSDAELERLITEFLLKEGLSFRKCSEYVQLMLYLRNLERSEVA